MPDGTKVFITGDSYGGASTDQDYATIAYNAATGSKFWARRHDRAANAPDEPFGLAVSPEGTKVFVTGQATENVASDYDYTRSRTTPRPG